MDSPISLLHSDLITIILGYLIAECAASNGDPIACGPEDDTILASSNIIQCAAQVSTSWRSICIGNPVWWSNISIVHPWRLEDIKMRLERAQQCPLDLRIFGHIGYTTRTRKGVNPRHPPSLAPTRQMYKDLFEIILPILKRCRILHLRGVFADENRVLPFQLLRDIVDAPMPMLEHLIWEGELNEFSQELSRPDCDAFFLCAPKLQQMRLIGIDVTKFHTPSLDSFPSTSQLLTTLHLSRGSSSAIQVSLIQLKSILQSCPLLSTLAIYDNVLDIHSDVDSIPLCTAPSLTSLYMLGYMHSVSQLLLFLHAPQMTELIIAPMVCSDLQLLLNHHPVNFATSRADRFPKLTSLTLAPASRDMEFTFISATDCFPLIERLVLVLPPRGYLVNALYAFFSDIMARTHKMNTSFPHLQELALHLDLDSPPAFQSTHNGVEQKIRTRPQEPSQYERLSRWSKAIHEILRIRDKDLGQPLKNIFVDERTFFAFKTCAQHSSGMDKSPDSGREDTDLQGHRETLHFGDMPPVKMGNFWEDQRRRLLFRKYKDLFLGNACEGV